MITDDVKSVAYVNLDGGMASDLVKLRVLEALNRELGEGVYTAVGKYHVKYYFCCTIFINFRG